MKLILLRDSGSSHAMRLQPALLFGVLGSLLALVTCTLMLALAHWRTPPVDDATVAEWRERLAEQQQRVAEIRRQADAESQAVGKQLAQMQARLLRMEALGARVTEVADLDEGEFSFGEPAPQGGPLAPRQAMPWEDLRGELDALAQNLRVREGELELLESFLRNQEFQDAKAPAGRPVTWGWLSSPYGHRVDPFTGQKAWHAGVDFAGKANSEVIAVAAGVVTHAGKRYGYGEMVEINHGDGFVTRYGHHAKVLVKAGDIVKKGQVIGRMGSSGRSTGPHVHFEVLKNGRHVDPARYVARRR